MADRDLLITMYRNNPELQDTLKTGHWAHDLCGCFDNLGICIIAYFVPCVSWGQTAGELGKRFVRHACACVFRVCILSASVSVNIA